MRGRELRANGIVKDSSDKLVVESYILLADGEEDELVQLLLAETEANEAPEVGEVLISSFGSDTLHDSGPESEQIDPRGRL